MAALGRDAFVALPDVKPITAMTLVVGYALGPLPGFTVGALGMLASNFVLGQGPYTPWQMAAWGLVGLAGAALGALSRRRLGRVQLALAGGLAALFAKELMNVYQWTIGASHTPAALLAVAGTGGLPFDLADVVASFLFGLAFAPELARLLARMRSRMEVTWEPVESPTVAAVRPPDGPRADGLRSLGAPGGLVALLVVLALGLAVPHVASAASLGRGLLLPPRRTPTAASGAPAGSAAASCTRAGRRWGSPPRAQPGDRSAQRAFAAGLAAR